MSISKEDVKKYLGGLNVLELAALIKELEDEWGVKAAAAAVAVAAPAAAPAAAAAPAEEKVDFTVILTKAGDERVKTIKVVREVTGLGLVEAKNLVEGLPKELKANVPKEEAESIKKKFAEVGATVDIK